MTRRNLDVKETAVKEKRIWVRLTRHCNNGCLFCLDSDSHDGRSIPDEDIENQIRSGRGDGGQRLILSGGEPTIHPRFVEFVRLGRALGYDWIQTISNGRMFAYRKFADAALRAGLNEVTLSMHGHTPELHDRLVGVEGAFNQALIGMRNLLGRAVVNVDVVLSKVNIPHLRDLLLFYIELGITEFDLLHMVPFGRAWNEHREVLFYDPEAMLPHLNKAFALRNRQGIIIWTNRLPAAYLEGNEDLIQDPHKMHDEVRGRLAMFQAWEKDGSEPVCRDDRCGCCPMDGFCKALAEVIENRAAGESPAVEIRLSETADYVPGDLIELMRSRPALPVYLPAEGSVALLLESLPPEELGRVTLYQLRHEYLSEAGERDLTPVDSAALCRRYGIRFEGLPPCLGGGLSDARDRLPAQVMDDDGNIDFVRFTDWFIRNRYFVKSLRCRRCAYDGDCRGLHVNTARAIGLGKLRPISQRGRPKRPGTEA